MIHGEMTIGYRAEPDLVIAFAGANEIAARILQKSFQLPQKPDHFSGWD